MPIYTRTGDKGKTSLFDGTRVFKSDARVNAYGTVDELDSAIGAAVAHLPQPKGKVLAHDLMQIQHDLLEVGSTLAHPEALPPVGLSTRPEEFEKMIDEMTENMPPLTNFILPGGSKASAMLHVARTTARRAERQIVSLMQTEEIDEGIVKYINRLSDVLFTMARFANHLENKRDVVWVKK